MRILYLNSLYTPHIGGGAEITLKTLISGIHERGHEVAVLTTGPELGLHEDRVDGVRVLRVGVGNVYWHFRETRPPAWQRTIWHLRDIYNAAMGAWVEHVVKQVRPDVVSCHNLAGFSTAAWTAIKRTRTPFVQVLHDFYNLCPNSNMFSRGHACEKQCWRCKVFRWFHPKLSECVHAVVGVSRFVLDRHLQNGLFQNARIKKVIHNARSLSPLPHKSARPRDNRVYFGFMGTLAPAKGIELLLRIFSKLNQPNARLLIAGTGKRGYEEPLKTQFASQKIRFLGYCSPENFFSMIEILIVPSIWEEALGMVIPESLAYGVPVIGSRRGGIPEMIEPGKNGFLFEPDRPEELAAIICGVAENPSSIEDLIPNALTSSRPFLDVPRWVDQWQSLYEELAQMKKVGGC